MLDPPDDARRVPRAPMVDQAMAWNVNHERARCDNLLIEAEDANGPAVRLDRSLDDGQVRKYLLLDRRDQNNCPLPISYPVLDQPQALGRNLAAPQPITPTRPARPARPGQ
jgi:hypothetical protein